MCKWLLAQDMAVARFTGLDDLMYGEGFESELDSEVVSLLKTRLLEGNSRGAKAASLPVLDATRCRGLTGATVSEAVCADGGKLLWDRPPQQRAAAFLPLCETRWSFGLNQ